jgi:hypothetical protein
MVERKVGLLPCTAARAGSPISTSVRSTAPPTTVLGVHAPRFGVCQQVLRLTSVHNDPSQAAEDMAHRLSTSPATWADSFGNRLG